KILHRARGEVGNRDQVELVARIGQSVVIGKPFEREGADLASPRGQRALSRQVRNPQRRTRIDRLGGLELAYDEREQVAGHLDRLLEDDLFFASAEAAFALEPAVGKRGQSLI